MNSYCSATSSIVFDALALAHLHGINESDRMTVLAAEEGPRLARPISDDWDVSVNICTYNRCRLLLDSLNSILSQQAVGVRYEVVVVDNNSTDDTKPVVDSFIARGCSNLRYVFEARQGLSYARNTAVREARAPILALTDDDVQVAPNWVSTIKRTFENQPEVGWIGGKVLPRWASTPPRWLTRDHWSPLAAQDHGDVPFSSSGRQVCLVGANLAIRKDLLEQFGGFRPDVQRVQDSVGSMEDHELQIRLWKAGRHGLYVPDLVVMSDVSADRLMKKYHRRWHRGHGHFYAMARLEELEHSSVGWLFGVSSHIYKRAVVEALRWLGCVARGNLHGAFTHETNLWFAAGFIGTRYREFATAGDRSHWTELSRFVRAVARRLISGQRHSSKAGIRQSRQSSRREMRPDEPPSRS
jgi:glucosyl-dolichyl phosphate glucuronosyltransferase